MFILVFIVFIDEIIVVIIFMCFFIIICGVNVEIVKIVISKMLLIIELSVRNVDSCLKLGFIIFGYSVWINVVSFIYIIIIIINNIVNFYLLVGFLNIDFKLCIKVGLCFFFSF